MDLKTWVDAKRGRASTLAKAIGVYPSFVTKMALGKKPIPLEKCMPIEIATGGAVTRRDLKPQEYLKHWPELAITESDRAQLSDQRRAIEALANGPQVALFHGAP